MKRLGGSILLIMTFLLCLIFCVNALADGQDAPKSDAEHPAPSLDTADEEDDSQAQDDSKPDDNNSSDGAKPGEDATGSDEKPALIQRVRVTVPMAGACLFPGQRAQAYATVSPEEADHRALEWSTSNARYATVDKGGMIHIPSSAKVPEQGAFVDVWAKAKDGSFAMNCATIRIMPASTKVQFLQSDLVVTTSAQPSTLSVPVEIAPASCYGYTQIEWASSNPEIVSVSPSGSSGEIGLLTWSNVPGHAVITAQSLDGSYRMDQLNVVVVSASHSIEMVPPPLIERDVPIFLSVIVRNSRDEILDIPVTWSLVSDVQGATLTERGELLVDRRCRVSHLLISATAQDEGMATGYMTIQLAPTFIIG